MKLQRTTLILLLLALGLGGFVYFYEIQGATQRQEAKAQKQKIFSFNEEQVQSFTVKNKNQTLKFELSNQSGKPKWQMKDPSDTPASDASVSYLLNLLVSGKSDRTLSVPVAQLREYGLDRPGATVEVKLNNQKTHRLILGKPNFDRSFLYAQADPPTQATGQVDVLLVSTDFENAVNRSLSEWKQTPASKDAPATKPTAKNGQPDKVP
jgi:hypothetical protein